MYERILKNRLPKTNFFLFGPRQVGKSTLLYNEKLDLVIDLLDPELQLSYNKNPNLLRQQIDDIPHNIKQIDYEITRKELTAKVKSAYFFWIYLKNKDEVCYVSA